jgi:neck protein
MGVRSGMTSFFMNNFKSSQEQTLLSNLIAESISFMGEDVYYIPRQINDPDKLYTADDQSSYTDSYLMAMYVESIDGFQGDGSFMSKFGLEIRDQVTFSVSIDVFDRQVGSQNGQLRPNEGDLIYFPLNSKCFQIKYADKFEMFYALGTVYTWKMTCELFAYSDELLDTGIPGVDNLQLNYSTNALDWSITDEDGNELVDETDDENYLVVEGYDLTEILGTGTGEDIQTEADTFIDFSTENPFSADEY